MMELHIEFYLCNECGNSQGFWVPQPAPIDLVLKGGGCQECVTPQNKFKLARVVGRSSKTGKAT